MSQKSNLTRPLLSAISIMLLGAVIHLPAQAETKRTVTELATGVYEIEHRDADDGFVNGNTTVIIGDRQVFVVDSCFLPSYAREDIAQIRKWTDKPVAFLLNTHFHNDHNIGNRVYLDAFPALTIIAHAETKKEMDMYGPSSASRVEKTNARFQEILASGKARGGRALTAEEITQLKDALAIRMPITEELKGVKFQSATLTFEEGFTVDIGNREVQVRFLGRGNTPGDAVVYLPKEKIVVAGDLIVHPIPYMYDGYPSEWIQTLDRMGRLDATTVVPGHGPVMHDKTYLYLMRDVMQAAIDQMNTQLRGSGPAMSKTLDDVKGGVDLSSFRERFTGGDKDLIPAFDDMVSHLVKLVFEEASLR